MAENNNKKEVKILFSKEQFETFEKIKNLSGVKSESDCGKMLIVIAIGNVAEKVFGYPENAQQKACKDYLESVCKERFVTKPPIEINEKSMIFLRGFIKGKLKNE